jgi:hypothetical protein
MALEEIGVGRRDAWLIASFLEQSRQNPDVEERTVAHRRIVLKEFARRHDGDLHTAALTDFEEPANRPGRTLDCFLRFVDQNPD